MKKIFSRWFANCKNRIERRLDKTQDTPTVKPQLAAGNIHYEVSDKANGLLCGGIGAIHLLARRIGLIDDINRNLHLLKVHLRPRIRSRPQLRLQRHLQRHLSARHRTPPKGRELPRCSGHATHPRPDHRRRLLSRRFTDHDVEKLIDALTITRRRVWAEQPDDFFACATVDLDGTLTPTTGRCKLGMDIAYNGLWGYHPLIVSLANTGEILSIIDAGVANGRVSAKWK